METQEKKMTIKNKKKLILIIAAAVLLVVGVVVAIVVARGSAGSAADEEPVGEVQDEPEVAVTPDPTIRDPGALWIPDNVSQYERDLAANYHVSGELPRVMSIPRVGIYARTTTVGLDSDGNVGVPVDLRMTAWYEHSSLPGQKGVSLIVGHGGSFGSGIFNGLADVVEGDEIFIEMGDEQTRYVYKIVDVAWKAKGAEANAYMKTALSDLPSGKPSLTLITCNGTWIAAERTFSHRIFVRAELEYNE